MVSGVVEPNFEVTSPHCGAIQLYLYRAFMLQSVSQLSKHFRKIPVIY